MGAARCRTRRVGPGLFAVGDLRSGSTKRVAAAVGEGSAAIRSVHEHLALTVDAEQARDDSRKPHVGRSIARRRDPVTSVTVRPVGPARERDERRQPPPHRRWLPGHSDGADVLGFLALAAGADLELDGLAFGQRRCARLEVGDVDEHVITAVAGDETEPAVVVEELHFALHS